MEENEMTTEIRTVLIKDWDPVEIGKNSNLGDEYDGNIGSIIQILMHARNTIFDTLYDGFRPSKYIHVNSI